ncbi:DUF4192 family protein [Actinoplanes oblitus]|uniref:DUF4192 family protein n=1 Tax=Actinoplanes oblitus TaxID=3040509 RepID=A0ABY8WQ93_9ACTN|nr:DUF4192 family protein [Actinoplanes oblitus]WIN00031.1 DUF4192 family protein [Actinoplanes oblitus]
MSGSFVPARTHTTSEVLGLVPHLLGYHPTDALVAIFVSPDRTARNTACLALNEPIEALLEHLALRLPPGASGTVLVGYGQTARPIVAAAAEVLSLMAPVTGRYLYDGSRFFCLTPGCDCTPADGIRIVADDTRTAVKLAAAGVSVAPDAAAMQTLVAADPVAQAATRAALDQISIGYKPSTADLSRLMGQARSGQSLTADEVAQLTVALRERGLLIEAWRHTGDALWQRDLWLDALRRTPGGDATAAAALTAWSAWRRGEDALAGAAHERARALAPRNGLINLIGWLLGARIPAHRVPWLLTDSTAAAPVRDRP